jgi:hypothetical protein
MHNSARLRSVAVCPKGEWVRHALEESLRRGGGDGTSSDPVARLGRLNAPTAGIEQMLSEIGAGRS